MQNSQSWSIQIVHRRVMQTYKRHLLLETQNYTVNIQSKFVDENGNITRKILKIVTMRL
jgi:hypothetical protein